jgi:hypothetical protein
VLSKSAKEQDIEGLGDNAKDYLPPAVQDLSR